MPEDQPNQPPATTTGGQSSSMGGIGGSVNAPAPAPEPQSTPEPASDGYEDPLTALQNLLAPKPKPKEEPKPASQEKPKEASEPQKAPPTPPEGQKPQEGVTAGQEKPSGGARELRAALDNAKKENSTLKQELDRLKSVKPEDPEKKTLADRLAEREKMVAEYEKEMKLVRFEKSHEYKEKYLKPIETAIKTAHEEMSYFTIQNEDGTSRVANANDFNAILSIQNPADALRVAKENFGDYAMEIISHRRKILDMHKQQKEAIASFQAQAEERERTESMQQSQAQEKAQTIWEETIRTQSEKFPQWFAPEDGDDEGNEILQQGSKIADLVFAGSKGVPFEKKVQLEATVRNKAAAFDRLAYKNTKLETKIKDLEGELQDLKNSAPRESTTTTEPTEDDSWQSELDKALLGRK